VAIVKGKSGSRPTVFGGDPLNQQGGLTKAHGAARSISPAAKAGVELIDSGYRG